ncbi:MAG: TetR/AcrR family transcriptional regulator [Spirosoma sp.]|nr:TetR/AcrR family transcriptional regulator [Spirosoma sp.]
MSWKIIQDLYFPWQALMKDEILQSSLNMCLRYGIRQMSIQKLVESLNISTKTVYKYYKNKEELLEAVLYRYHGEQYQMLENLPSRENAACLFFTIWQIAMDNEYQINKVFYEDLHDYYPELEQKVNAVIAQKFEQYFLSVIHQAIDEEAFRDDILPEVALRSVPVLHRAAVRTEAFNRFGLSAQALMIHTTGQYIRSLCTPNGLQAVDEHIQASLTTPVTQ